MSEGEGIAQEAANAANAGGHTATVPPPRPTDSQGRTAGMLLRQAREAAAMDIAILASMLKVPVGKLQALEDDNFVELPDAVFARAVAASVCRTLHIESATILALLPHNEVPRLRSHSDGINATFKEPGAKMALPSLHLSGSSRRVMWAVLGLLVAAAALYAVPTDVLQRFSASAPDEDAPVEPVLAREPSPPSVLVPVPTAIAASSTGTAVPIASTAPSASVTTPATAAVAGAKMPVQMPMQIPVMVPASLPVAAASMSQPASQPASRPAEPTAAAAAAAGVLEFRARAESWVQVRDASGRVTFERVLKAGDAVQAVGKPPLSVVVGRVEATQVLVRGVAFDLTTVARDNVARFEVK